METIASYKHDVWGQEVLLGVSWDILWLVCTTVLALIIIHAIVMAILRKKETLPSPEGKRVRRHDAFDRAFHWIMAASVIVLLITGVLPIIGIHFNWLNLHWIAGLILTFVIVLHIIRAVIWQDFKSMLMGPSDLMEPLDSSKKPGKYSFAQKGMHWTMTILVLGVIYTGILLFLQIQTPWWERSNAMPESELGMMFFLHGLATLALIALSAIHVYFGLRPEKRFYTRSMIKGWISEDEYAKNHDSSKWAPEESNK